MRIFIPIPRYRLDCMNPVPAITLNSGGVYANYVSGSGTAALLFRYTVITGDSDPDGIAVAGSIDLNGATIRDTLGNDAATTLNYDLPKQVGLIALHGSERPPGWAPAPGRR